MESSPAPGGTHDVFLSYRKLDSDRAMLLEEWLEEAGIDTWWDREIRHGSDWSQTITRKIRASKAVVVLWTRHSVGEEGQWVQNEARFGLKRKALFPILAEPVELPIEFSHVQTPDLSGWDFESDNPVFEAWLADLKQFLATAPEPSADDSSESDEAPRPAPISTRRLGGLRLLGLAGIAAVSLAAAGYAATRSVPEIGLDLGDMRFDGVLMTAAADVDVHTIPMTEKLVVDGDLGTVVVRPPRAEDVFRVDDASELAILDFGGAGDLRIGGLELTAGNTFELQGVGGEYTLELGHQADWSVSLTGIWDVDVDGSPVELDFGSGGSITVGGGGAAALRFVPDYADGPITFLEGASVSALSFSYFNRLDPDLTVESTVQGGSVAFTNGAVTALSVGSRLAFDRFDGSVTRLQLASDTLRADFVGSAVAGVRLNDRDLMPTLWEARTGVEQSVALGLLALYLLVLGGAAYRWRRRIR